MLHLVYCASINYKLEGLLFMEKNQYQGLSRTSRRKRRNKKFPKKAAIALLLVAIFCLIGGGGYIFLKNQQAPNANSVTEDKEFKEKETSLLQAIRKTQEQSGLQTTEQTTTQDNMQTFVYEPTDAATIPQLTDLNKELKNLVAETKKKTAQNTPIKLVGYLKKTQPSKKVDGYQPEVLTYTWQSDKQNWTETILQSPTAAYVNQTTKRPLTLQDLIPDESSGLAIKQVVQQKLLDESPDGSAIIDSVLNMPNLPLDSTGFSYYPDKLTLQLPTPIDGKSDVTIPYEEIAGYINTELVAPASIQNALPKTLDPNKKYISLTFDDGPNPDTTPRLLDILKAKGVKATFFMLGQNVAKHEALVKRVADEGHEVASHSYSHPQLTSVDASRVKEEVQKTDKAIYQATGCLPTDFRPPYGAVNKDVATLIGKPIIQWSVDSQDWQSHNASAIIKRINDTAYNDTIVLMHDIHPDTIDAVPEVIDSLRAAGYEILPTKELLGNKAKPLHMYYGSQDERPIQ